MNSVEQSQSLIESTIKHLTLLDPRGTRLDPRQWFPPREEQAIVPRQSAGALIISQGIEGEPVPQAIQKIIQDLWQPANEELRGALSTSVMQNNLGRLSNYLPGEKSAELTGRFVGENGAVLLNPALSDLALRYGMGIESWGLRAIIRVRYAEKFLETWKVAGGFLGGGAAILALQLSSMAWKKLTKSSAKEIDLEAALLGLAYTEEKDGETIYKNAKGETIRPRELQRMKISVMKQNILASLAKCTKREELPLAVCKYFSVNREKQLTWLDGTVLTDSEMKIVRLGIDDLMDTATLGADEYKSEIEAMVKLIAEKTVGSNLRYTLYDLLGVTRDINVEGATISYHDKETGELLSKRCVHILALSLYCISGELADKNPSMKEMQEELLGEIKILTGIQDLKNITPLEYIGIKNDAGVLKDVYTGKTLSTKTVYQTVLMNLKDYQALVKKVGMSEETQKQMKNELEKQMNITDLDAITPLEYLGIKKHNDQYLDRFSSKTFTKEDLLHTEIYWPEAAQFTDEEKERWAEFLISLS